MLTFPLVDTSVVKENGMGIMLFSIFFLIFVLLIVPMLTKNTRTAREPKTVEVKSLDGSTLNFSDDGVSYFKDGNFKFFRKSELKRFSFEKLSEGTYEIKLDDGKEIVTVPVKKEELQKLFTRTHAPSGSSIYVSEFPWLGAILGTTTTFLLADILADSMEDAVEHLHEEENQYINRDSDESSNSNDDSQEDIYSGETKGYCDYDDCTSQDGLADYDFTDFDDNFNDF